MRADAGLPLRAEMELCRLSLAFFAQRAWRVLEPSADLKWGWALDAICAHLEAVTDGKIRRMVVNVPPGSMKSLLVGVIWPAWEWGPRAMPWARYLGTAHKQELAIRDAMKCRRLVSSPWYQKRWPVELAADNNQKMRFENLQTGFREAMSFTSLTGSRGDRVLIDDPHSVDGANSYAHLSAAVRTFREAVPSRVNSDKSAIIIIMQRLHEADVAAAALDLGYDHLCIPMRYEAASPRPPTAIGWTDPRIEDGELMFPERFTAAMVAELELSLGSYASAGQLQQRPAPAGGGVIKADWLQYWQVLPDLEYLNIYADTALKTAEENDYSVLELWGKGRDGRIYLVDVKRGKWESPQLLAQALAFWDASRARWGGALRKMKIEDKASGTGLVQQLRQRRIPVEGIPRSIDKMTRAHDAAPQIEAGNVWLPERHEYLNDLIDELALFPAAAHDDLVDPLFDAVADMLNGNKIDSVGLMVPKRLRRAR